MRLKKSFPLIFLILLILIILLGRLQIIFVRFFDPDEFAHLHWAYLLSFGKLPYRDFFFYITPLYQWFLSPIFLLPPNPTLLLVARLWQYVFYLASLMLLYKISNIITGNKSVCLLSVFIMSLFPMTFDKTIDIRPDMLMVFFFLLGIFLLIRKKDWVKKDLFFSGIFFGLALLILPKIIFAVPAILFLVIFKNRKNIWYTLVWLILGFIIPVLSFVLYLLIHNLFTPAFQSIFVDSFAVNTGKIPFSLWLALSPWPLVYLDHAGFSLPWVVNLSLFILMLPGLFFLWKINKQSAIFILLFFVCGITFLILFPVPYLQYFLPFTPFISFLAAVVLDRIFNISNQLTKMPILLIMIGIVFLASFYQQYRGRSFPSNGEQLKVLADILTYTKPEESIYDMVGSYVFRPDGYYICCHPYAEFASRLKMKVLTLSEALTASQTKFLVQDRTGLLFWKPAPDDLTFLVSNYLPSKYHKIYTLGHQYSCKISRCTKLDKDGKPLSSASTSDFQIIAADNYKVDISPEGGIVLIDEKVVQNGSVFLTAGNHTLNFPSNITYLKIQLYR